MNKVDRKKVIIGLEICTANPPTCRGCPYYDSCKIDAQKLKEDALALLKEQEAMPIKADKPWNKYNCPACNAPLHRTTWFTFPTRFCKYCGQAVKWDA